MSERGNFRGRGGGGGGRGGGDRGGGRGGRGGHAQGAEKPKKENILDLTKYMDKEITVKFNGGREGEWSLCAKSFWDWVLMFRLVVIGTLKGYDQLMNLVLDDVKELLRGEFYSSRSTVLFGFLQSLQANAPSLQTTRATSRPAPSASSSPVEPYSSS